MRSEIAIQCFEIAGAAASAPPRSTLSMPANGLRWCHLVDNPDLDPYAAGRSRLAPVGINDDAVNGAVGFADSVRVGSRRIGKATERDGIESGQDDQADGDVARCHGSISFRPFDVRHGRRPQ
jgi:hypothetical protein